MSSTRKRSASSMGGGKTSGDNNKSPSPKKSSSSASTASSPAKRQKKVETTTTTTTTKGKGKKGASTKSNGGGEAASAAAAAATTTTHPQTEMLKSFNGKYKATFTFDFNGERKSEHGVTVAKPLFGGKVIQYDWKGSVMGNDFEGYGVVSYSTRDNEFHSDWWDAMSSSLFPMKGKQLSDTKFEVLTIGGPFLDEMGSGKKKTQRQVWEFFNDGKRIVMDAYNLMEGSKKEEWAMAVEYKKQ
jgi:hypothetical protein